MEKTIRRLKVSGAQAVQTTLGEVLEHIEAKAKPSFVEVGRNDTNSRGRCRLLSLFFSVIYYFAPLGGTAFEEVVKPADTIPAVAIRL